MDSAGVMDDENDQSTADPTAAGQDAYANFAFLIHSQTSLMHLPPTVDTAMTARQKRRRTSPEDHAVLEAAYQENSKPDKSERMEIVKRVTLSEKEVQIWFQNRRQNDRRKSRPLLPHEMVPHFRNSVPQVLLDSALPGNIASTQPRCSPWSAGEVPHSPSVDEPKHSSSRASSIYDLLNPPYSIKDQTTISSDTPPADNDALQVSQSSTSVSQPTSEGKLQRAEENEAATCPQDAKLSPGGLKRTHDEMIEKEAAAKDVLAIQIPSLPSQSSHVRLSMSLEGAVKVKTTDAETPSPPKQRAPLPTVPSRAPAGLQRSKSAIMLSSNVGQESAGKPKVKSVGGQFGRSRDARTWEFYCDGDAREALSAHAEDERTGSAVGAINLIRSQSQTARAQMMTERSGGSNTKNPPMSQRSVRPKPSRAKSSMARLQDTDQTLAKPSMEEANPSVLRSPSGDSDKENWAPGTQLSHHPLRRQHASTSRRPILGGDHHRLSHARSTGGLAADQKRSGIIRQPVVMDKENIDCSSRHQRLIEEAGKGEDLDCIQGLLSLSQGAWQ